MTVLEETRQLFLATTGWVERYSHIVDLASRLPVMPDDLKTPDNRVACASTIYFSVAAEGDRLRVRAYANTAIPSGLAALLVGTFDGVPLADAPRLLSDLSSFLHESELLDNLTPPRRAALLAMIERVRLFNKS
ncbi:MAG: SufE family protein [Odoribacteraceae bacterium]|jgi:sulfur transfer protein SufE|nr:SufE family protein [Odoribacteraceae bacterium]